MRPRLAFGVLLVAVVAVPSALAHGGAIIDQALHSLRTGDPVFVHEDAIPRLEPAEAIALRERIAVAGVDVYVAVLPADAMHEAGSAEGVLEELQHGLGVDATYAVVVGGVFGAATRDGPLGRDAAARHASAALEAHRQESLGPLLLDFVDRVAADPEGSRLAGESDGWLVEGVLAALGLGSLVLLATLARARRRSSVG